MAQRAGAKITGIEGSHVIMISQPDTVTDGRAGGLDHRSGPGQQVRLHDRDVLEVRCRAIQNVSLPGSATDPACPGLYRQLHRHASTADVS
jgi:hypothetical protein